MPIMLWSVAGLALILQGCAGCDDAGCSDSVTITVADGDVRAVELLVDADVIRCDDAASLDYSSGSHRCDLERDATGATRFSFLLQHPAKSFTVRAFDSAGVVIHAGEHAPEYELVRPNGEGCPPVCNVAALRI